MTRSSTGTQGSGPATHDSTHFRTVFTYGKYLVVCIGDEVLPQIWAAGSTITSGLEDVYPPNSGFCVNERAGSTYTKSTSEQVEFNAGVTIGNHLGGVDLSAQTGWDINDSTSLTAPGSGSPARPCGSNDVPGGTPKKLEYALR